MSTYQTMPPLAADEYEQLRESIRADGVKVPVIFDEDGNIIDGHHRVMIARELSVPYPSYTEFGLSEAQKVAMSITLNVARRNLNREQRRAIIAESLKAQPEKSNREHARQLGVSDNTVGAVRRDLEERAQIAHVEERTDSIGRQQPASKPEPIAKMTETLKTESYVNTDTGEVVEELPTTSTPDGTVIAEQRKVTVTQERDHEREKQDTADKNARALASALETLDALKYERKRQIFINEWIPRGQDAVPPDPRKLFDPEPIRAIASFLITFASEMENQQ